MKLRITHVAVIAVLAGAVGITPASAQDANSSKSAKTMMVKGADQKFVMEASQGGMTEVKLGKLAQDKASSADVKQFGQRMVDDHTKAGDQLKSIASTKGITVPSDIGAKNQSMYDQLSKLSGAQFDAAYMKHMTADHKKDVAEFQKEANSGKDADIKGFASQTLPTLQEHLKMAQDVSAKVSGGSTSADRMKSKDMK